jgi:predicted Fe-S protein YdhL (DUF1289 family)
MEYCPECGSEARTDVTYCPGCGTDLTEYREWASTAEQEDSAVTDSGGEETADATGDETARTPADENGPAETNAGGAGRQQGQGQTGHVDGQGSGARPGQRDAGAQQRNPPGQGAGQSTPGQGQGSQGGRNVDQPRGQPQGGQPRNGPQSGRGAPSAQGGQPGRGQQPGAPTQSRQGQGAPEPGAVDQGPSLLDRIKALPLKESAVAGAGLYVVSFLLAYVTFIADALAINGSGHDLSVSNLLPFTSVSSGSPLDMWQLVGWLMYSGHSVAIERTVDGSTDAVEVLGEEFWAQFAVPQLVTPILYTLIPLLVLAVGGFAFVKYLDDGTTVTEATDAALLGASILVGYVALAVVGTFLVSVSDGGMSAGPVLEDAAIWAAVFAGGAGAVGGVAAQSLGDDASPETAPPSDAR